MTFEREERYIVIKRSDLDSDTERMLRDEMVNLGVPTRECVVVESDWPEFDTVWRMIEARCGGRPFDPTQALRQFYADVHAGNVTAGWWSNIETGERKKRSVGEMFMLFVTELAEAYDAYAEGNTNDDKLPHLPGLAVELGDLEIRFADFCGGLAAGSIVAYSGVRNPGDAMFREVVEIARRYEAIRKSPEAVGDAETGDYLPAQDVPGAIDEKRQFNASRADHKVENRLLGDGKRT